MSWSSAAKVGVAIAVVAGTAALGMPGMAAASTPGAPTITSVVPGTYDNSLVVRFKAPADNGGATVHQYLAHCTPVAGGKGGERAGQTSPISVFGLSGGKQYTCRVRAKNSAGYGPYSTPSNVVVPKSPPAPVIPDPPTTISATPAVAAIEVRFNLARSPGQRVTGYRALCTSTDGMHHNQQRHGGPPILVDNLLEAKAYTCKVQARNPSGWSAYSKSSNVAVTKTYRPGAPKITSVTAGVRSLGVRYQRPANGGGSKISSFHATCTSSNGGVSGSQSGLSPTLEVANLSAGKTYRCQVTATNSYGTGPPSAPSQPVVVKA